MKNTILILSILIAGITSLSGQKLYSGEWEADSYFTTFKGSWTIEKEGDKTYVVMGENFSAKKAPDLKIYFSKLDFDDVDEDNANSKDTSVFVSKLNSYKGAKKYEVPAGIDISAYKTILVHCVKYTKYWGGSPLKK